MIKRTPTEWQVITGIKILDPDGWDRMGDFKTDWNIPITAETFIEKASRSTTMNYNSLEDILKNI